MKKISSVNVIGSILNHFESGEKLTVKDCMRLYGTCDLRKYMTLLKRKGYENQDFWEESINRHGDTVKFKVYYL